MTYNTGDQLEIKIEKIVPNGLGMGFAEKLTVFVPLSAEGDKVLVELRQIKGRTAFAAIEKIVEPSPFRVEAPCGYYGECGGCDFQHISYESQVAAKIGIIKDCLSRIGHIDFDREIKVVPCRSQTGYRLRTQFHAEAEAHEIGFFRRQSHEIIDIDRCLVLTDSMNKALTGIRENLDFHVIDEKITNIEVAAVGDAKSFYSESSTERIQELSLSLSGETYSFNAKSFFQANEPMLEDLIAEATGGESGKSAIDFYCGAGLFSIPLARNFSEVVGVESSPDSVGFARKNRDASGLKNLEFFGGRVREFLADPATLPADFVIVDPPRSGVKDKLLKQIAALCTERLVYVSCNPSTLARDLGTLLGLGFRIESITALDLFPQTHHVETVVKLRRGQ